MFRLHTAISIKFTSFNISQSLSPPLSSHRTPSSIILTSFTLISYYIYLLSSNILFIIFLLSLSNCFILSSYSLLHPAIRCIIIFIQFLPSSVIIVFLHFFFANPHQDFITVRFYHLLLFSSHYSSLLIVLGKLLSVYICY